MSFVDALRASSCPSPFSLLYLQPGEMSLEEIEGKLGSLIPGDTISQLKSGVWKERLEGFCLFFMN